MQISDILRRDKESSNSPRKFNFIFFIKDSWFKIVLSLLLSISITIIVKLNLEDFYSVFSEESIYGKLIYVAIGAVPEFILQRVKKKFGFTQPTVVKVDEEEFKRK